MSRGPPGFRRAPTGYFPGMTGLPDSTLTGLEIDEPGSAAAWGRRGFLILLLALVLTGLTGFLGVHESTVEKSGDGYLLRVRYAAVARAGLDVPWEVTVTKPGGFSGPIRLAVTGAYFDDFESQGFFPEPAGSTRDAHTLFLTFDPPPGDTFTLSYDAYVQPSSQRGGSAVIAVVGSDHHAVVSAHIDTTLLP